MELAKTLPGMRMFTYDGDTPQDARRAVRSRANLVLSNPDMLHSGILPHHTKWVMMRGKPETGTIAVRLQREGAEVVIVVEDDGAGLDVAAIRAKARHLGLLRPDQSITDEETLQLILEPGFSTAERLTQQAGRGVGMDVVASEVKKLGGGLFIESHPGPRRALHDPPAVHAGDNAGADRPRP